jgi:GNAT superfamily N-acetyltransferase
MAIPTFLIIFRIWESELTISPAYIESNDVWVYEQDEAIVGLYSILLLDKQLNVAGTVLECGHWLDHMFIRPSHIGRGIGTDLIKHLRTRCAKRDIRQISILADPNVRGFYEKMGCRYVREIQSTIAGRTTPQLVLFVATG